MLMLCGYRANRRSGVSSPSDGQRHCVVVRVSGLMKLVGGALFRGVLVGVDGDTDRIAGFGLHIAKEHHVHHLAIDQGGVPASGALERVFLPGRIPPAGGTRLPDVLGLLGGGAHGDQRLDASIDSPGGLVRSYTSHTVS